MKLFDAHCHLQTGISAADVPGLMKRAAAAGVGRIVCCGTCPDDWAAVLHLAKEYPAVLSMIGIHPWFVPSDPEKNIRALEALLNDPSVTGIGETGLDFSKKDSSRSAQEECFSVQLDLARKRNLPIAVHCVRAWGPLLRILREHPAPRVLLHAFSGSVEIIPELTALNCSFSFCGSITDPRAKRARAAAAAVSEDRILIETDSPDFTPAGCAPPNEPANLMDVLRAVSELRGTPPDRLADQIFINSESFFNREAA